MRRLIGTLAVIVVAIVAIGLLVTAQRDVAAVLQVITPPFLIVAVAVVFALLLLRTIGNLQVSVRTVPLLQARDLLTFFYFAVLVTAQQYSRATGARLSDFAWWVILSDVLAISVGAFWLAIELKILGRARE